MYFGSLLMHCVFTSKLAKICSRTGGQCDRVSAQQVDEGQMPAVAESTSSFQLSQRSHHQLVLFAAFTLSAEIHFRAVQKCADLVHLRLSKKM